jgi:AcrR family transcriptional regulator
MTVTSSFTAEAPPLRRDAAANRERVLAAAVEIFGTSGADASMDDVARRAGVGVGTVYRRFPTKEDLIQAIMAQLLRDLVAEARQALAAAPEAGVEVFLTGAGELQARYAGCLWQLWSSGPECDEVRAELRTTVREVLGRAQRAGAVRGDLAYEDVAMLLWSLAGVVESVREAEPDLWRRSLEIMLLGIKPSDAPLHQPPLGARGLDEVARMTTRRRSGE